VELTPGVIFVVPVIPPIVPIYVVDDHNVDVTAVEVVIVRVVIVRVVIVEVDPVEVVVDLVAERVVAEVRVAKVQQFGLIEVVVGNLLVEPIVVHVEVDLLRHGRCAGRQHHRKRRRRGRHQLLLCHLFARFL
jgi:hypothetical protein